MQRGFISKRSGSWVLRYWDSEITDRGPVRVRRAVRLAEVSKDYPTKRSVALLADKVLSALNSGLVQPESALTVKRFIEVHYLPFVQKELKASTYRD